jgi:SAM-dependent methyltransferase
VTADGAAGAASVRGAADRRALGQWFTAAPIAELALAALGPIDPHARVIDPMCGDGAFLAAAHAGGARDLTGVEIDRDAAARARAHVPARIVDGDALAPGLVAQLGAFDVVIGNPPWVRAGSVDPAIKRARANQLSADWPELDRELIASIARLADVAASCVLRALRLLRPGGRLALVMSTALLDADGAAPLWRAVEAIAHVRAIIVAPGERWFADAAVNPMLVIAERRGGADDRARPPRLLRLRVPTAIAARACGLDAIARDADERFADDREAASACASWAIALRAPPAWFAWRAAAGSMLVPLGELADVRRGVTTGANRVFYVARARASELRLERAYLAPVVRSPFNGSPAPITVAPDESPVVAITLPPDPRMLKRAPRIAAWLRAHADDAAHSSVQRRDPWWSLPVHPARLFLAKAYGPRFVQRFADVPMLGDQRVYALSPRAGVDLAALAAVLNALPTALAIESLGRGSMGYGAIEWTVADARRLPVLDVRRADSRAIATLTTALAGFGARPIEHVRKERDRADRGVLDAAAFALVGADAATVHAHPMWSALLSSVALRDRYLLPAIQ